MIGPDQPDRQDNPNQGINLHQQRQMDPNQIISPQQQDDSMNPPSYQQDDPTQQQHHHHEGPLSGVNPHVPNSPAQPVQTQQSEHAGGFRSMGRIPAQPQFDDDGGDLESGQQTVHVQGKKQENNTKTTAYTNYQTEDDINTGNHEMKNLFKDDWGMPRPGRQQVPQDMGIMDSKLFGIFSAVVFCFLIVESILLSTGLDSDEEHETYGRVAFYLVIVAIVLQAIILGLIFIHPEDHPRAIVTTFLHVALTLVAAEICNLIRYDSDAVWEHIIMISCAVASYLQMTFLIWVADSKLSTVANQNAPEGRKVAQLKKQLRHALAYNDSLLTDQDRVKKDCVRIKNENQTLKHSHRVTIDQKDRRIRTLLDDWHEKDLATTQMKNELDRLKEQQSSQLAAVLQQHHELENEKAQFDTNLDTVTRQRDEAMVALSKAQQMEKEWELKYHQVHQELLDSTDACTQSKALAEELQIAKAAINRDSELKIETLKSQISMLEQDITNKQARLDNCQECVRMRNKYDNLKGKALSALKMRERCEQYKAALEMAKEKILALQRQLKLKDHTFQKHLNIVRNHSDQFNRNIAQYDVSL